DLQQNQLRPQLRTHQGGYLACGQRISLRIELSITEEFQNLFLMSSIGLFSQRCQINLRHRQSEPCRHEVNVGWPKLLSEELSARAKVAGYQDKADLVGWRAAIIEQLSEPQRKGKKLLTLTEVKNRRRLKGLLFLAVENLHARHG